jgi:hypothetical protein
MQTSYITFIVLVFIVFGVGYLFGKRASGTPDTRVPMMPPSPPHAPNTHLSKNDVHTQIRDLLSRQQKIEAIKFLRYQRGLGLKEAKDYVEALERGLSPAFDIGD